MVSIKESLTFDDVLLLPQYSNVLPSQTDISLKLTNNINLKVPYLSSAMDTVTESKMAIAIAESGGVGVIHRNLNIKNQTKEIIKVKKKKLIVGAAVGTNKEELDRARSLVTNGCDLIVIDTAKKLYNAGADIIKVGIGPGSICTTRMVAGIGVPQISAIMEVKKVLKNKKIKIISDGGIKFSGDIAKALAAGADAIMMGSIFAGTEESPGKKFKFKGKTYKQYRGMGSIGAMSSGSAMGYIGAKNLKEILKNAKFIKITKAGFYESMVHSVEMTQKKINYKL